MLLRAKERPMNKGKNKSCRYFTTTTLTVFGTIFTYLVCKYLSIMYEGYTSVGHIGRSNCVSVTLTYYLTKFGQTSHECDGQW